ncbi:MAG TPA: hypothetical protein VKE94_04855 [Gemmataceae bacterium]|nr:hypothetical protein [Gemmataceae bacterium]
MSGCVAWKRIPWQYRQPITELGKDARTPNPADPILFHKTRERYQRILSAVADKVEVQTSGTKEESRGQAPN